MNLLSHLFVCLQEECIEMAHGISKILRFTPGEISPPHAKSNLELLEDEYNDFLGAKELLEELGIRLERNESKVAAKKAKLLRYIDKASSLGTVDLITVTTRTSWINFEKFLIDDFLQDARLGAYCMDDGTGYYATESFEIKTSVFSTDGMINLPPPLATHVNWYAK